MKIALREWEPLPGLKAKLAVPWLVSCDSVSAANPLQPALRLTSQKTIEPEVTAVPEELTVAVSVTTVP
ncbi:hypothetical protein [Granulicella sibirica]|uniref:hypothetical protein n=1 Tax=Granulicella sibirica TaxID=2479048 RepID=UPI001F4F1626|nr:hypothetical protein [Granulicella sibirica]